MTRIHAEKQKIQRFPRKRHDSVYKEGLGWLISPDVEVSGLRVSDDNRTVDIDICIPSLTRDQIKVDAHEECIKQNRRFPARTEELIHIVFPKKITKG